MITASYSNDSGTYSAEEIDNLKSLQFSEEMESGRIRVWRHKKIFTKKIPVEGVMYAQAKNLSEIKSKFKQERTVGFFKETVEDKVDPRRVMTKISALPFAIVFDVITLPLQVLFFRPH